MGKNSSLYNKVYYKLTREKLIKKLGGECEVCGIKHDLIIHRVFSPYNMGSPIYDLQTTLDGNIGAVNKYTAISSADFKQRTKMLLTNPDNMTLVCHNCYSVLRKIYGRKQRIGRKEIFALRDLN